VSIRLEFPRECGPKAMASLPPHRSRLRRVLLACGVVFVVAASLGQIAYQELDFPLIADRTPVILAGRIVTRAPGIKVDDVLVQFRRPEANQPGQRRYVQTTVTDRSGRFSFAANFRGQVHLFFDLRRIRDWSYRPIPDVVVPTTRPLEIELIEGAAASGRVVRDGKPAAGISVALSFADPAAHDFFGAFRAETDAQGRFRFQHLPEAVEFWISRASGSLFDVQVGDGNPPDHGTIIPRRFRTELDKTTIDLGDLELRPGLTIAGRVVLADGKAVPDTCIVVAGRPETANWLFAKADQNGEFAIRGLPQGPLSVYVGRVWGANPPGVPVLLPHYHLSPKNRYFDAADRVRLAGWLERDVAALVILMEPWPDVDAARGLNAYWKLNSVGLAPFQDGIPGPITDGSAAHSFRYDSVSSPRR
jgi:hypothetical protein